jgi:phosphomannomutase/phosphoglucomutase
MVSTPEIRIDCPEWRKFEVVKAVCEYFKDRFECIDLDGVRIEFDGGWGLVRASNTQAKVVLRFEAKTPERLQEIRGLVEGKLREVMRGEAT